MTSYSEFAQALKQRMEDLLRRAQVIEDDLRHPLEADSSEQAIDLADDETLIGVDDVLRAEIGQIRQALGRIDNGTYGVCANCGGRISQELLRARPIATRCIECASAA
ncbi:TraR/DksA family transcriptional regulator [Erythrobacter sp. SCSIO 43205]|uniref:TraR/DksA family transcriptional regulator n=1 Tax=Erythrobacter sp. SCSIO 43205 TaxID=2779361 RepID=UPI001CA91292|nr:TraR/DksA family transcriptional regulator [Erythrobacter sp. SCSIO 43205]UAB76801.1 TraR/DksA family transcriptional regulator [Erythrobacter sp. SCSIO 43205]